MTVSLNITKEEIRDLSNALLLKSLEGFLNIERKSSHIILFHLKEIKERKLYAERGYPDLHTMLVEHFKVSETSTQQRLKALELMMAVPKAEEAYKNGDVHLTNLAMAQRQILREEKLSKEKITQEKKQEIVEQILNKTQDQAKIEVFKLLPKACETPENHVNRVSAEGLKASLYFPNRVIEKKERLKELWSHIDPNLDIVEIIERAFDIALNQEDPLRRERKRKSKTTTAEPPSTSSQRLTDRCENKSGDDQPTETSGLSSRPITHTRKTYFTIEEDRLLYERAQNQCEFTDPLTGNRCQSRHLLQKDHIIPIAQGGTNDLDNLRLLCHTHNQLRAHHHFGAKFMKAKLIRND